MEGPGAVGKIHQVKPGITLAPAAPQAHACGDGGIFGLPFPTLGARSPVCRGRATNVKIGMESGGMVLYAHGLIFWVGGLN